MVLRYRRLGSLLLAIALLGSCVLSPLSIRVSATTQNDDVILAEQENTAEAFEEDYGDVPVEIFGEEPGEDTADAPVEISGEAEDPLEPDFSGEPLIPGMQEHMVSKPGSDYKSVTPSVSFFSYLDLELFQGAEVDHINVYVNRVAAENENQYMTVFVVDSATAQVAGEYRFYARAESLAGFTTGRLVSLYPEEGVTVAVGQGQTLGFGKNGDPLVCNFQNDNNVPASLKGFYMSSGFTSGTAGGCLCVDVYAKEEPLTSDRDAALVQALAGKKLSILGDSISTYAGVSNSTAVNSTLGSNALGYTDKMAPFSVLQTWWKQAADRSGMEVLVNNSWGSSTVTSKNLTAASYGWNTRPENLHDNTLSDNPDGAPVNPDIIAIYMGTNDVLGGVACSSDGLDEAFFARIEAEGYEPETGNFEDACALMVHKVRKNYPDADIFLFNNPTMKSGAADTRAACNQVFEILAQRYGCVVVDLYNSAISDYASYTTEGVHPNSAGMDVMTDVFLDALYARYLNHTEHTWVTIPALEPTCTKTGLTEGTRCALCRLESVPQEVAEALGHSYGPGEVTTNVNDYDPVYTVYTCTACGDVYKVMEKESMTWDSVHLSTGNRLYSGYTPALIAPLSQEFTYEGAELLKDLAPGGANIYLKVDGKKTLFSRGLGAHATSTLVYDIGAFTQEYTEFSTYVGVDYSRGSKGSVWFEVLSSTDGENWTSLHKTDVLNGASEAVLIRVNVQGARYLKLHANANGDTGNDHSVYGEPRLIHGGTWEGLQPLEELDAAIQAHYDGGGSLEDILPTLYRREFISRIGYDRLESAIASDNIRPETLEWLVSDIQALELYLEAGVPEKPDQALIVLEELYKAYQDILTLEAPTTAQRTYEKMILAAAVAYAGDFIASPMALTGDTYNPYLFPVGRVQIMMDLYNKPQGEGFSNNAWVDNYHMELMRSVMLDHIENDEVMWLRGFSNGNMGPASFIPYNGNSSMNYGDAAQPQLYDPANNEYYNNKYKLNDYGIYVGQDKQIRTWMVMAAGGVCWNIARMGQTLYHTYGRPAIAAMQPVHEAYFSYDQNANGEGYWGIGYDVFGWANSFSHHGIGGKAYNTRFLMGWGSDTPYSQKNTNNGAYMLLAQACINDRADTRLSWQYEMLARVYSLEDSSQLARRESIYRKGLEIQPLNLDCWLGLMEVYEAKAADSEQWEGLAQEIMNALTYYPVPMDDLTREIRTNRDLLEADQVRIMQGRTAALERCTTATASNTLQWNQARQYARVLLNGTNSAELVSFSFDGENAGKIILGDVYAGSEINVKYSLDGGSTWSEAIHFSAETKDKAIQLSQAELASIVHIPDTTDEEGNTVHVDEIQLNIQFVAVDTYNDISLDILPGAAPVVNRADASSQISIHDGENWILGKTANLEYSTDGLNWTAYDHSLTRFTGSQVVQVRYKANGLTLPSAAVSLTFAENDSAEFTHISVAEVTLVRDNNSAYYNNRPGNLAIDANPFTSWHSAYGVAEADKQLVVKFGQEKWFSGLTYQREGSNGCFSGVTVYVSDDGESWTEVGKATGWANNTDLKTLKLERSVKATYVKLQATTHNNYISARDIDFYEDTTGVTVAVPAVTEYIKLDGKSVWLVKQSAQPEEGKTYVYDGTPMFYSETYGAYCCLAIAKTLDQESAAANIRVTEGTAATLTGNSLDVNGTGVVDASDAQLIYNMYTACYDGFSGDVTMEKFLRADINGDGLVDTKDAVAVIAAIIDA